MLNARYMYMSNQRVKPVENNFPSYFRSFRFFFSYQKNPFITKINSFRLYWGLTSVIAKFFGKKGYIIFITENFLIGILRLVSYVFPLHYGSLSFTFFFFCYVIPVTPSTDSSMYIVQARGIDQKWESLHEKNSSSWELVHTHRKVFTKPVFFIPSCWIFVKWMESYIEFENTVESMNWNKIY